jgi:hypothetical protein
MQVSVTLNRPETMNKKFFYCFICSVSSVFCSYSFGQSDSVQVKAIGSVWDLSSQPCNGGGGNLLKRNPNEAEIKEKKIITLKDLGFQLAIPLLPDLEKTYIKLFLNDKSRGVVDHYVLFAQGDLAPPTAAIVITELPTEMRTTKDGLEAVKILQEKSASRAGIPISLTHIAGPYGDSLELLIKNRVGSHCYPTSDYQLSQDQKKLKTIGISRFSVIGSKLVEFALIINASTTMSEEAAAEYARKTMDAFWLSLKSI